MYTATVMHDESGAEYDLLSQGAGEVNAADTSNPNRIVWGDLASALRSVSRSSPKAARVVSACCRSESWIRTSPLPSGGTG
jgi:hypothetical protein